MRNQVMCSVNSFALEYWLALFEKRPAAFRIVFAFETGGDGRIEAVHIRMLGMT